MHEDFWQARWARDETGFHLKEINPYLLRHWPRLELPANARVLVPLCGKSLDLLWLAERGLQILGVELAQKAVEDFFAERKLQPQVRQQGAFKIYQAETIELWCGDFFALTPADVSDCRAFYDRAALIALPERMREKYLTHLQQVLPPRCQGLLITLDYEQAQRQGPPFAVPDSEVRMGFSEIWKLECLERQDVLQQSWKFLKTGLTRLEESVYRLRRE